MNTNTIWKAIIEQKILKEKLWEDPRATSVDDDLVWFTETDRSRFVRIDSLSI